jgi:3-oxoacyl-[acyl-carrier-protein] synthase II
MSKKVYVLDYETISPLGIGEEEISNSIKSNYIAGQDPCGFSTDGLKSHGAAFVDQDLSALYKKEPSEILDVIKYDRKFELLVSTYKLAEKRLKSILAGSNPDRAGVILGVGLDVTPIEKIKKHMDRYLDSSESAFQDTLLDFNSFENQTLAKLQNPLDLASVYLAEELNLGAFQKTVITACTSSTQAISLSYKSIVNNEADIVLTGGTDSIINLMAYTAFGKLGIIAKSDKSAKEYCKPFDVNRCGALVGEAAGLCLLASEDYVLRHGLKPRFELLGYGNSLDGYKITSADPSGDGMRRAIEMSINMSGVDVQDIDYVNLHGTATRLNDELELKSFMEVVGDRGQNISVSSTKSRHGHAIAAAGIQEFNLLCNCMENNLAPGSVNLEKPVVESGIDLIKINKLKDLKIGMTNNFAFGGVNSSLIIRKVSNE